MALEICWSKRADKKFDKILEYLSEEWGERVTRNFVKKVYSFLEILSEYPEIGTIENEEKGIRGFTVVKDINIFYKVTEERVILLNFLVLRRISWVALMDNHKTIPERYDQMLIKEAYK